VSSIARFAASRAGLAIFGGTIMFRKTDWMILLGIAVLLFGGVNFWIQYLRLVPSPFDLADSQTAAEDFIPIVIPVGEDHATPAAPTVAMGADAGHAAALPAGFAGALPDRLVIPAIQLDAPVAAVHYRDVESGGTVYQQWRVPAQFAAGWQDTSALLGLPGNTVLNGHHNAHGMVFGDLVKLQVGDQIIVYGEGWKITYEVAAKMLVPERGQPLATRLENARWLEASADERLTLVTCWPADSNTHRVIVVAFPVGRPVRQAPPGESAER
jgi:sortase A